MSEEYSPVVFAGGGGAVADAYPLVVVESDSALVSGLRSVVSDSALSVLPVAGCEFPAVFLGKVAFDAVGSCCPGIDPGDEVGNEILDGWSTKDHKWYGKYEIRTADDGVSLDAIQTDV